MTLKDVLLKPIKLIGGGVLDLKGFRKSIINKDLGGGDKFPYEYIFIQELTVNIKKEDIVIEDGVLNAATNIDPIDIGSIDSSKVIVNGYCNEAQINVDESSVDNYLFFSNVPILNIYADVSLYIYDNKISRVEIRSEDASEFVPDDFALNFTELLFIKL